MSKQLFILFRDASPTDIIWLDYSANCLTEINPENQAALSTAAQNAHVVVILPAKEFSFFRIKIPSKNESNFIKAVPFSLEENVISSVDELFFAAEKKGLETEKGRGIWVINDARLQEYLGCLSDLHIDASHIVPESALLSNPDSNCSLWFEGNRAILSHDDSVVSIEVTQLGLIFDSLLPQKEDEYSCDIMDFTGQSMLHRLTSESKLGVQLINNEFDAKQYLRRLASRFLNRSPVNLIQGKHQQRINILETLKRWRFAAVSLFAILLFQLITVAIENAKLSSQIQKIDKQTKQLYRKTFPRISKLSIAKAKLQQIIQSNGLSHSTDMNIGFSSLLSDVGNIIISNKKLLIQKVDYKKNNLRFTVSAENIDLIDNVFKQIEKGKYSAKLESQSNKGKSVIGVIRVSHPS